MSESHADRIRQAVLVQEAAARIPRALIAEAVDLVVYIERCGAGRRVGQVAAVMGCEGDDYILRQEK